MSDQTKACNLTKDEIQTLIEHHGLYIRVNNTNERIERIKYLHSRLKSFSEGDTKSEPNAAGWSSNNG